MKKFDYKKWAAKPITRGDYVKACVWAMAASVVMTGATYGYYFRDEIKDFATNTIEKIKNRKEETVDYVEMEDEAA